MPDLPVNEYIDTVSGLARIRGNEKIYARMLGLFQQSEEFDKFEAAMAAGDMNAAADVAHAIKGMSGNLSLTKVFDLSADLMNQLRGGTYDETTRGVLFVFPCGGLPEPPQIRRQSKGWLRPRFAPRGGFFHPAAAGQRRSRDIPRAARGWPPPQRCRRRAR